MLVVCCVAEDGGGRGEAETRWSHSQHHNRGHTHNINNQQQSATTIRRHSIDTRKTTKGKSRKSRKTTMSVLVLIMEIASSSEIYLERIRTSRFRSYCPCVHFWITHLFYPDIMENLSTSYNFSISIILLLNWTLNNLVLRNSNNKGLLTLISPSFDRVDQ